MPPKLIAFFLALSAYSWGVAFVGHVATWVDTTVDLRADGTPALYGNGEAVTTTTPRWYFFPLLGNIVGGYAGFIAFAAITTDNKEWRSKP